MQPAPRRFTANSEAAGVRLYVFPLEAVRAVQRHYSDGSLSNLRQPMSTTRNLTLKVSGIDAVVRSSATCSPGHKLPTTTGRFL
jgi:hypothetical protein